MKTKTKSIVRMAAIIAIMLMFSIPCLAGTITVTGTGTYLSSGTFYTTDDTINVTCMFDYGSSQTGSVVLQRYYNGSWVTKDSYYFSGKWTIFASLDGDAPGYHRVIVRTYSSTSMELNVYYVS